MGVKSVECNKDCATCQTGCGIKCPVCGAACIAVESATVANLSKVPIKLDHAFYICLNPKCKTSYFDDQDTILVLDDIKVPIWFKSSFLDYMVCYCRQIYLKDIIRAVLSIENPTKEEIIKFLEKENIETNCLLNNPLGKDCDLLFNNAIEYAIKLKQKGDTTNVK